MEFDGKRLLILGGNPETVPLVQIAQSMGVYVVVSDDNPNAMAKKFANKSYNINGLDVAGLVALAKEECVDGVLVGVADILIGAYQKVCEKLGFPCYATEESVSILTQKDKFNEACSRFGILGIPRFKLDTDMNQEDLEAIRYPVVIKPVDSGGGVGMTVCENEDELRMGVAEALAHSKAKRFMVEKYMTCDDMFFYYTVKDGKCYLSAIADRHTTKEQGKLSSVCMAATYPSKHTDLYFHTIHTGMCTMLNSIGVRNGVLNIQGFVEDGCIYVYDPGFRLQGEAPHLLINAVNGFDHRKMLICFSLTGSMGDIDLDKVNDCMFHGKAAGSLWILLKRGVIGKIAGMEAIRNDANTVSVVQRLYEGDNVTEAMLGNEKQVLARIYLLCNTREELKRKIREIQSKLKVTDINGDNMQLEPFNVEKAWA